jgi:hypothetical protein
MLPEVLRLLLSAVTCQLGAAAVAAAVAMQVTQALRLLLLMALPLLLRPAAAQHELH